jgi:hypothetical protein
MLILYASVVPSVLSTTGKGKKTDLLQKSEIDSESCNFLAAAGGPPAPQKEKGRARGPARNSSN